MVHPYPYRNIGFYSLNINKAIHMPNPGLHLDPRVKPEDDKW